MPSSQPRTCAGLGALQRLADARRLAGFKRSRPKELAMALQRWMCSLACVSMLVAPTPQIARGDTGQEIVAGEPSLPAVAASVPPPATVTITSTGISPASVTIYTGTAVSWYNASDGTRSVASGAPSVVRVPHVLVLPGAQAGAMRAGRIEVGTASAFLGVIPPGGTYSYTFTDPGLSLYFVKEQPRISGAVHARAWPEISVLSVAAGPQPAPLDGTLRITAVVANAGGDALPFEVNWQADPQWWPGLPAPYAGSWNVDGLAPGVTALLTTTVVVTAAGTFVLRVSADAGDALPEVDKSDNVRAEPAEISGTVEVCGSLPGSTTWAQRTYVLACDLTIPAGVTLTLTDGVVLKPKSDSVSIYVQGMLASSGTAETPVIITSYKDDSAGGDTNGDGAATTPAAGDWVTLMVNAGGRVWMDRTVMRYAGAWRGTPYWDSLGHVFVQSGATAALRDTHVLTGAYGVRVRGTLTATRLLAANNQNDGVLVEGGALTLLDSEVCGSGRHGVALSAVSDPVISGTALISNAANAIHLNVWDLPLSTLQVRGNTASGNGRNGLVLAGTQVSGTSQLTADPGFAYVLDGFAVGPGGRLSVPEGTVLKVAGANDVTVRGVMSLTGTAGRPVTVTSLADDSAGGDTNGDGAATGPAAADWGTLVVNTGGQVWMDWTVMRYAGSWHGTPYWDSLGHLFVDSGGVAEVQNSQLSYGAHGVRIRGALRVTHSAILSGTQSAVFIEGAAAVQVMSSTLSGNNMGVSFSGTLSPTLSGNAIMGNAAWGVQNNTAFTITAANNWWGSATGPTHASNPGGTGDKVTDGVTFSPFMTSMPQVGYQMFLTVNAAKSARYSVFWVSRTSGNSLRTGYARKAAIIPARSGDSSTL